MHKLVTPKGVEFNAASFVKIGDRYYDMDDMTPAQREYIGTCINIRGLNSAYAGRREFYAEGLKPFQEVFPGV